MEILDETCEKGVIERRFNLTVNGEIVPGIHWLPEAASAPHPTVLIGHGGTQHKRVPNVLGLARIHRILTRDSRSLTGLLDWPAADVEDCVTPLR